MIVQAFRHTSTDAALKGRCYGWSDVALSEQGICDIALAARGVRSAPARIVSSDLSRCARLAKHIAQALGAPLIFDADWRERSFGNWELQGWDDIHAAAPGEIDALSRPDFAPPGGESLMAMAGRVRRALAKLNAGDLVVAHGGSIAVACAMLSGAALDQSARFIPPCGGATALDLSGFA